MSNPTGQVLPMKAAAIAAIVKEARFPGRLDAEGAPVGGLVDAVVRHATVEISRAALPADQTAGRNVPAVVSAVDVIAAPVALRRVRALRAEGQSSGGIRTTITAGSGKAPEIAAAAGIIDASVAIGRAAGGVAEPVVRAVERAGGGTALVVTRAALAGTAVIAVVVGRGALSLIANALPTALLVALTISLVATAVVLPVVRESVVVTEDGDEVAVLDALARMEAGAADGDPSLLGAGPPASERRGSRRQENSDRASPRAR